MQYFFSTLVLIAIFQFGYNLNIYNFKTIDTCSLYTLYDYIQINYQLTLQSIKIEFYQPCILIATKHYSLKIYTRVSNVLIEIIS